MIKSSLFPTDVRTGCISFLVETQLFVSHPTELGRAWRSASTIYFPPLRPLVLSIFNADGFDLAPRRQSQEHVQGCCWPAFLCHAAKKKKAARNVNKQGGKKKKRKAVLFCDTRWLFTQSCLDPRRGALNSQSGGIKIATLQSTRSERLCVGTGCLKLLLHFFLCCHMNLKSCVVNRRGYSVPFWGRQIHWKIEKYIEFAFSVVLSGRNMRGSFSAKR